MNERIQELHQQAKDYINEVSDADGVYQGKEYPQAVREKFAELIVEECVSICTRGDIEKPMGLMYSKQIKKHFGVE